MATYQSDIIAAKDALNISDKSMDGAKTGATVLHATAVYTMKGTETGGDIIELTDLPPSARVLPHDSRVSLGGTGGFRAATLLLGDKNSPYRYGRARLDRDESPGSNIVSSAFGYVGDGYGVDPLPYEKTTRLIASFNDTPSSKITGGKIVFDISYTING